MRDIMPKNRYSKTQDRTEKKLRAANAEIKRLRYNARHCTCDPFCPIEHARKIKRLCDIINATPPEEYKSRARRVAQEMMAAGQTGSAAAKR